MGKKRIGVWLSTDPQTGGAFQYNLSVINALNLVAKDNQDLYEFYIFTTIGYWIDYLKDDQFALFKVIKITRNIIHKIFQKVLKNNSLGIKIWQHINNIQIIFGYFPIYSKRLDLLICPAGDSLAYELNIPSISTVHDMMHRYGKEAGMDFIVAYGKKSYLERERNIRLLCHYAKIIVVDSAIGKKHIIKAYPEFLRAEIMPLSFIPPMYILQSRNKPLSSMVKIKFNLPEQYLFYPAQFCKDKNHNNLLDALYLLKSRYNLSVNLVLVGQKHNNYVNIKNQIRHLELNGQVHILDYVADDDIIDLYKNAFALIMPTFYGPTNIPIVEAMFLGIPVICSNVFAMPNQVGDAALLVRPKDVTNIADTILELYTNKHLRRQLIAKGLRRTKDISIVNYGSEWRKIINQALQ